MVRQQNFFQKIVSKIKPGFWLYVAIYAMVLIIGASAFLIYTENSLVRYEKSQAINVVEKFAKDLKKQALKEQLPDGARVPSLYTVFNLEDAFMDDFGAQFSKDTKMTVMKQKDSYDTSRPAYDIYAGDVRVAEIELEAVNSKVIFGLLTISDWKVNYFEPIVQAYEADNVTVTIPNTHKITINGVTVDQTFAKKQDIAVAEFATFKQYLKDQVTLSEYEIPGALMNGTLKITNKDGGEVLYTPKENGDIYVNYGEYATAVPSPYGETAMNIAKTWDNFLTSDLPGNGLSTVVPCLIKGSNFHEQAIIYVNNDLWMVSAHNTASNVYSNVATKDYTRYTEDCFSCHVRFTKTMYLYKQNKYATTEMDSVIYFVHYDDTDDGVVNPAWKMVAMATASK